MEKHWPGPRSSARGAGLTARTRQRWLVELDGMLREKFFKNCPAGSYDAVGADRAWNDQLAEER